MSRDVQVAGALLCKCGQFRGHVLQRGHGSTQDAQSPPGTAPCHATIRSYLSLDLAGPDNK